MMPMPMTNGFAERFGGGAPQPASPIRPVNTVGAPIPGAPGAAAPVSQPAPAPAPVMANGFGQRIGAPAMGPSGFGGVRPMMPPAMPPQASSPNPFNDLRMRLGLR